MASSPSAVVQRDSHASTLTYSSTPSCHIDGGAPPSVPSTLGSAPPKTMQGDDTLSNASGSSTNNLLAITTVGAAAVVEKKRKIKQVDAWIDVAKRVVPDTDPSKWASKDLQAFKKLVGAKVSQMKEKCQKLLGGMRSGLKKTQG
jgi:hypothetical protein